MFAEHSNSTDRQASAGDHVVGDLSDFGRTAESVYAPDKALRERDSQFFHRTHTKRSTYRHYWESVLEAAVERWCSESVDALRTLRRWLRRQR